MIHSLYGNFKDIFLLTWPMVVVSLVTPRELGILKNIAGKLNIDIYECALRDGKVLIGNSIVYHGGRGGMKK